MAFVLYAMTAVLLLGVVHRFVTPLTLRAALIIFVLPLGITGIALVTGGVYGPIDHTYAYEPLSAHAAQFGIGPAKNASAVDVWSEFFPWREAVRRSFARGEWPLWNADNLCGHPLAAEAQSAPYSPFTWIALLLPAAVSMSYTAAIVLFLAALSGFLFGRELGCGEAASLVAAIGWSLGASNVVYVLTAMGFATIFAPAILAATRRVIRDPRIASGAFLTSALTLCLLAGHPESLFLNVLVGVAYAIFELLRHRANALRAIGVAIAAGVVALLLCAIFLLPLLEAFPQSHEFGMKRHGLDEVSHGVRHEQFLAALATDFFPYLHVREWRMPKLGYIGAETAAVGSIILALAIYALVRRRGAETWFFGVMTLFCLLAGARWQPLADAMQKLPVLEFTLHDRLAFHAALSLVALAALGVEELLRRRDFRVAAGIGGALLVVLCAGTWWLRANTRVGGTPADYGRWRIAADLGFLALMALMLAVRPRVAILLALLAGQRLVSEFETFGTYPAKAAYPRLELFAPLESVREPYRIVGRRLALPPGTNAFYGLEDVRGYEALTLKEFVATWPLWSEPYGIWFNSVNELHRPFLSFMNVRFAVQGKGHNVPEGWRVIARDPGGSTLLENANAIDRIFVPEHVFLTPASTKEVVDRMREVTDFRALAFITARGEPEERENGPGEITLRERSTGGRYLFDARMSRDGFVVISDSAWKGWRAYVDGKRVQLSRANAAFLAIPVPAGEHRVRLVYQPRSFVTGRAVSIGTLLVLIAASILARPWRFSSQTPKTR